MRKVVRPRLRAIPRSLDLSIGKIGAEEGTRTPTPLRVHGPEPCASANSATSASDNYAGRLGRLEGRCYGIYSTRVILGVKLEELKAHLAFSSDILPIQADCKVPSATCPFLAMEF